MTTTTSQPTSLINLPPVKHADLLHMLKRELFLALVPFIVLALGSFIATHRLPPGNRFVLESRGVGIWYDFLVTVLAAGLFAAFYVLPSLWVRRWLSIIYRILLFMTFTFALFLMEAENHIAVVQNGDRFTFVRRYPFGQVTIAARDITSISTHRSKVFAVLTIEAQTVGSKASENILCQHVWPSDQRTMRVMDELASTLRAARQTSLQPVAAPTTSR